MTPYVLLHESVPFGAPPGCGQPAYYLRRKPAAYAPTKSADAVHIDGSPVKPMGAMVCGSCGGPLVPMTKDIRPVPWEGRVAMACRMFLRSLRL